MTETKGNAEAEIVDGNIVITLSISHLQTAIDGGTMLGTIDGSWKLTDPAAFAKDFVRSLNSEDEEGTTMIHRMCDEAINDAIEQGAEGIEEIEEDDED
jgi:hypothetical protein